MAGHVNQTIYCVSIKADMSVTSLTSHNVGCPQEITIQVGETQYCFYEDNENYMLKKNIHVISPRVQGSFIFLKISGKLQIFNGIHTKTATSCCLSLIIKKNNPRRETKAFVLSHFFLTGGR